MNGDATFGLVFLGVIMIAGGMLYIVTSVNPQRNFLTQILYWITTIMPRVGSMTDKKWVLVNGVVLLLVGLLSILRAVLAVLLNWPVVVR